MRERMSGDSGAAVDMATGLRQRNKVRHSA
jgi:hypothetical protein